MTRNHEFGLMDIGRIGMAVATIIIVFIVSSSAERRATERDLAAREDIEDQVTQVYQVLQLVISRTASCAIEADKQGNVLWMNPLAKTTLRLSLGENVTSCMTASGAAAHTAGFERAMLSDQIYRQPLSVIPNCIALANDGNEIEVSVETWRTPNGAMAFVTPIHRTSASYSAVE